MTGPFDIVVRLPAPVSAALVRLRNAPPGFGEAFWLKSGEVRLTDDEWRAAIRRHLDRMAVMHGKAPPPNANVIRMAPTSPAARREG